MRPQATWSDFGVTEPPPENLTGYTAAGLWRGRKLPFVSTFGRFLERACDQIEMALIGGANLKLDGITSATTGAIPH